MSSSSIEHNYQRSSAATAAAAAAAAAAGGPFQRLFDVTQQYLAIQNSNDMKKPSCHSSTPVTNSTTSAANLAISTSSFNFNPNSHLYNSNSALTNHHNNHHQWKQQQQQHNHHQLYANNNNNNPVFNLSQVKYFPPHSSHSSQFGPPQPHHHHHHHHHPLANTHHSHHPIDFLANYLSHASGPSPDLIKFIDKVREEEMSIKIKDQPEAKLCEDDLWKKFNNLTTEMVITKSGRRMFPAFKVQLSGLDTKSRYVLALEVAPCDDNRFKFHNGKWTLAGKADPESHRLVHVHCESPSTGEAWMQKAVWFNKVKLTNNPTDKDPQHLVLNSMHKYVMRLHIFRCDDTSKVRFCLYPEIFTFKTTEFIAVTAYQNDKITQLKIDNNPFAKGFRDNGSGRREKKRLKTQPTITSTSPDSLEDSDEDTSPRKVNTKYACVSPSSAGNESQRRTLPDEESADTIDVEGLSCNIASQHGTKRRSNLTEFDIMMNNSIKKRNYLNWTSAPNSLEELQTSLLLKSAHTVHHTPQSPWPTPHQPHHSYHPNNLSLMENLDKLTSSAPHYRSSIFSSNPPPLFSSFQKLFSYPPSVTTSSHIPAPPNPSASSFNMLSKLHSLIAHHNEHNNASSFFQKNQPTFNASSHSANFDISIFGKANSNNKSKDDGGQMNETEEYDDEEQENQENQQDNNKDMKSEFVQLIQNSNETANKSNHSTFNISSLL